MFRPYQKKLDYLPQLSIFDNEKNRNVNLERKGCIKYLGVLIDEHLSWKHHINLITTKISKTVGLIAKLRHFVPYHILLNIYQSSIAPYLIYGLTVWANASKAYVDKITILQKCVLRLIHFTDRKEHAIPLFVIDNILPLNFLYYKFVCDFMHGVSNNVVQTNIMNLFSKKSNINSYRTRSSTSEST